MKKSLSEEEEGCEVKVEKIIVHGPRYKKYSY